MLTRLKIRGFALLEDVELELSPGLNVITGETGAGKSLVLGALALLLGGRSPAWSVRDGCEMRIDAEFRVGPETRRRIPGASSADDDGVLRLTRTRTPAGRGQCALGDRTVSIGRLRELARELVAFTFQHSQLELGSNAGFIAALDALADHSERRVEYARALDALSRARAERESLEHALRGGPARRLRSAEQLSMLRELAPAPLERRSIDEKLELLRRSEQYAELAARVKFVLGERECPVEDEVSGLARDALKLCASIPSARALFENLERASAELQECLRAAQRLELELDREPAELKALEARARELDRAAEALGVHADALFEEQRRLEGEVSSLEGAQDRFDAAVRRERQAREAALAQGQVLHDGRMRHVARLTQRIEAELRELALPDARLAIELCALPDGQLNEIGITSVQVGFAANLGEGFAPLAEVASGGERSRLLLTLQSLGLENAASTLVLDEIDAGLGGASAEAMAIRLNRLGRARQILCVTHQACIAARGDAHFCVSKSTEYGRTRAHVARLGARERASELTRMLGGVSSQAAARVLARELLQRAKSSRTQTTMSLRAQIS